MTRGEMDRDEVVGVGMGYDVMCLGDEAVEFCRVWWGILRIRRQKYSSYSRKGRTRYCSGRRVMHSSRCGILKT